MVALPLAAVPVLVRSRGAVLNVSVWMGTTSKPQVVPRFLARRGCLRDADELAELKILAVQRDEFQPPAAGLQMVA